MSLYQEGCPLSYIQQMLGHENISTTSGFYAFVTLDTLAKALERTNPEGGNAEKNWKDKKISEALSVKTIPTFFQEMPGTAGFPQNVGIVFLAV